MIGLDATALICRFQRPKSDESPSITEGRRRLALLAKAIDGAGERFEIPAPALGEFIVGLPKEQPQLAALNVMSRAFRIIPVDVAVIQKLTELWQALGGVSQLKRLVPELGYDRQVFKLDLEIIACAISRGARLLITGDKGVRSICRRVGLECHLACEIPDALVAAAIKRPAAQGNLFHQANEAEDEDDDDEEE